MRTPLLILFFLISSFVVAEPVFRVPDSLNTGERGEYLPKSSYKILGVDVNLSSLEGIEKTIGDAQIYKGHHTANHLCYTNDNQKIEFSISSLGFGYEITKNIATSKECASIAKKIENGIGLKVGLKKSEVLMLLGKPSVIKENSISYIYWVQEVPAQEAQDRLRRVHKLPSNFDLLLDVYSQVNIGFKNNVIDKFSVHTTETY
jgi:hypothetical protein